MKRIILFGMITLLAALLMAGLATASAVTSQLGYHPNSYKQVVVYTGGNSGTFDVRNASGNVVYSGNLTPTTCQGGQVCLVGQFSDLSQEGMYSIDTSKGYQTDNFQISSDVFKNQESTFLEFFEANRQVDSAYHADLHKAQVPDFPMQADGSFIHEAWMSTTTLIRLGSAYQKNPGFFTTDKYTTLGMGELDMLENIRQYTDYLVMLQDATPDKAVSKGWNNNFQCGTANPYEEKWNDEPEECMTFINETQDIYTAQTLLAYTKALPALEDQNASNAFQILQRAKDTASYLEGRNLSGGSQAFYGAALFQLYDYTGDETYFQNAYDIRGSVAHSIAIHNMQGNEFYWEEYVKHESEIKDRGLNYTVAGRDPVSFFDTSGYSYSEGEEVLNWGGDFQVSRPMMITALYSTKKNGMVSDQEAQIRADSQISWLTGMNSIQDGHGDGAKIRRSFIFGIGTNPQEYHSRLNPNQQDFLNGINFIPGWVSGVYDSNGDNIYNHDDNYDSWRFTESTNHMVALAIENFAYMDAIYTGGVPPADRNITESNNTGVVDDNSSDTNTSETGLVRTDTDGDLTADFFCKPADTSDDLVVDWSFGDGTNRIDVSTNQSHTYNSSGSYLVQCDVWDNQFGKFISEQEWFRIGAVDDTTGNDTSTNDTTTDNSTGDSNSTGLVRTDSGDLEPTFSCKPEGGSDDLVVDWNFGDGVSKTDVDAIQTHAYSSSGSYFVQCDAWDNVNAELTSLQKWFDISGDSSDNTTENTTNSSETSDLNLKVKEWYPKGRDYVFVCENGAPQYTWRFGDNHTQETSDSDVYHTYDSAGNYTVTCISEGESASLDITVS